MFTKHVSGIKNIFSFRPLHVKLCMDSLINANAYLASFWLIKNVYISSTPTSLIYSLRVIHLDTCVIIKEFTNGLEYSYKILNYHRINIKHDKTSTSTDIVVHPRSMDFLSLIFYEQYVTISRKLNFDQHLNDIIKNATQNHDMLYPILNKISPLPMKNLLNLLLHYVSSILIYAGSF